MRGRDLLLCSQGRQDIGDCGRGGGPGGPSANEEPGKTADAIQESGVRRAIAVLDSDSGRGLGTRGAPSCTWRPSSATRTKRRRRRATRKSGLHVSRLIAYHLKDGEKLPFSLPRRSDRFGIRGDRRCASRGPRGPGTACSNRTGAFCCSAGSRPRRPSRRGAARPAKPAGRSPPRAGPGPNAASLRAGRRGRMDARIRRRGQHQFQPGRPAFRPPAGHPRATASRNSRPRPQDL